MRTDDNAARQILCNLDRQREQAKGARLAVRVEPEARVDATFKRVVDHEIERGETRQRVARNVRRAAMGEQRSHARFRYLIEQHRPRVRMIGDDADVEAVAFVAGASMSDPVQGKRRRSSRRHAFASQKLNRARVRSRGITYERVRIRAWTLVRTPPPPAGPQQ